MFDPSQFLNPKIVKQDKATKLVLWKVYVHEDSDPLFVLIYKACQVQMTYNLKIALKNFETLQKTQKRAHETYLIKEV